MQKLWFLLSIGILALVAGCGPRWQIVKQANPNPMQAGSKFFLDKPSFDGLRIGEKSEQEWQAGKDSEQQGSWQGDKTAFLEQFTSTYNAERERVGSANAPAEGFAIKPHVTFVEPGYYAYAAAQPTQVRMTVQIVDPKGTVLDEFVVQSAIPATMTNPSVGGRLRDAAKDLGAVVAKYMKKRTGTD